MRLRCGGVLDVQILLGILRISFDFEGSVKLMESCYWSDMG